MSKKKHNQLVYVVIKVDYINFCGGRGGGECYNESTETQTIVTAVESDPS